MSSFPFHLRGKSCRYPNPLEDPIFATKNSLSITLFAGTVDFAWRGSGYSHLIVAESLSCSFRYLSRRGSGREAIDGYLSNTSNGGDDRHEGAINEHYRSLRWTPKYDIYTVVRPLKSSLGQRRSSI